MKTTVEESQQGHRKNWIYPVTDARSVRQSSEFENEKFAEKSPHGFVTRFQSGQLDEQWKLRLNVKHISVGDRIWLYYGATDFDMGVVGLGAVSEVTPFNDGTYRVEITWDQEATAHLIRGYSFEDPVRRFVPFTHAFRSLEGYPELVSILEKASGLTDRVTPQAHSLVRAKSRPTIITRRRTRFVGEAG